MGHERFVLVADSLGEAWERLEREGYYPGRADYCDVVLVVQVKNVTPRKLARILDAAGAVDEDPRELLEEARRMGKRLIIILDCHV